MLPKHLYTCNENIKFNFECAVFLLFWISWISLLDTTDIKGLKQFALDYDTSDIFLAVTDPETKVLQELADCRQYCIEGLGEAEACGDIEMQAEFFLQGAVLNITEGKSLEHTLSLLQVRTNNRQQHITHKMCLSK